VTAPLNLTAFHTADARRRRPVYIAPPARVLNRGMVGVLLGLVGRPPGLTVDAGDS
jgi:hypothetical protein